MKPNPRMEQARIVTRQIIGQIEEEAARNLIPKMLEEEPDLDQEQALKAARLVVAKCRQDMIAKARPMGEALLRKQIARNLRRRWSLRVVFIALVLLALCLALFAVR